ncbi:MAG: hypothetical protein ACOCX9_06915 [Spirochaetota bacterium]
MISGNFKSVVIITQNPAKEFSKQQLVAFEERYEDKVIHLIHDNDPIFV